MKIFALCILILTPQLFAQISARSPEVLASYAATPEFSSSIKKLKPKVRNFCQTLLNSQLRLQKETDSWKLYSLYEALTQEKLMTGELVRVPTVTEISGSLPKYTGYRLLKTMDNQDGSILVAAPGAACGPDPLAVTKGAYFVKCGSFLIGSGLMRIKDLKVSSCLNPRLLKNPALY